MTLSSLLPAPPPPHAHIAHVPLTPGRALLYLAAGCALTALTHRTNPGPLAFVGGLVALGLLFWEVHRHDQPLLSTIDTTPDRTWAPWLRTGAATLVWAALVLTAGAGVELAVGALMGGAYPLTGTGPTVLLPALIPTVALLTATLLEWARVRARETYTVAACAAVLTTLAAQGWEATPGALPVAAATVALAWLYRRTHRGIAVYLADGVATLALAAVPLP